MSFRDNQRRTKRSPFLFAIDKLDIICYTISNK